MIDKKVTRGRKWPENHIKKDSQIYVKTKSEIHDAFSKVCDEKNIKKSPVIEILILDFLAKNIGIRKTKALAKICNIKWENINDI